MCSLSSTIIANSKFSGCAKNALHLTSGFTTWSRSSHKYNNVWITRKTCLSLSVKGWLFLMLNHTGMYDFKMKISICFKFSEELGKLIYNLSILLATVSHLEYDRGPRSQNDKSCRQCPDIPLDMSNKYCWSLLSIFLESNSYFWLHEFILEHRELFASSKLLSNGPRKTFWPCGNTIYML